MAVFNVNPEFEFITQWKPDIMSTNLGDGQLRYRSHTKNPLRSFELRWELATETTKNTIETLFTASYGGASTMSYTPVNETDAILVKFFPGKDGFSRERVSATHFRVTVRFEQCYTTRAFNP